MNKMTFVLGVMMTLAMAAPADIVVFFDPGVDRGGGLTSYTVHMVADSADNKLVGFDGSFEGTLSQIKAEKDATLVDTPTLTNAALLTPDEQARDTHFLLWDTELKFAERDPNETTSLLDGAFTLHVAAQEQDLLFAQIVLPGGETAQLTGTASNASGVVSDVSRTIPEPMTVSLLSVGVVFVLRRRKPCQRRNASD
jgi:hypothetical protein